MAVRGGDRDRQVTAAAAGAFGALARGRDASSRTTTTTLGVDVRELRGANGTLSADHQCIVWCNQVVRAMSEAMLRVAAAGGARDAAERRVIARAALIDEKTETDRDKDGTETETADGDAFLRAVLAWTPAIVPASVAHLAFASARAERRAAARRAAGASASRVASASSALLALTRDAAWIGTFAVVFALTAIVAPPAHAPRWDGGGGGGVMRVASHLAGVPSFVFATSLSVVVVQALAIERVAAARRFLTRFRFLARGKDDGDDNDESSSSSWIDLAARAVAALFGAATTAAVATTCATQPAVGLAFALALSLNDATSTTTTTSTTSTTGDVAVAATLRALLTLQSFALYAPSLAAAIRVVIESQVRSIHWSPYDRVGVVDADP